MSQRQLGAIVGWPRWTVTWVESNSLTISVEQAMELAVAFDIPLMKLLGELADLVETERDAKRNGYTDDYRSQENTSGDSKDGV